MQAARKPNKATAQQPKRAPCRPSKRPCRAPAWRPAVAQACPPLRTPAAAGEWQQGRHWGKAGCLSSMRACTRPPSATVPRATKSCVTIPPTHRLELRGVEVVCAARQLVVVDVGADVHLAAVDLRQEGGRKRRARECVGSSCKTTMGGSGSKKQSRRRTCRILARASSLGCGNSILRSSRPGRGGGSWAGGRWQG